MPMLGAGCPGPDAAPRRPRRRRVHYHSYVDDASEPEEATATAATARGHEQIYRQILKLNFKTRGSPGPVSGNTTPQATVRRGPSPRSAPARRSAWISNPKTPRARRTRRS